MQARLNHDCEPEYDFVFLETEKASGWYTLASWDGFGVGLEVDETVDLQPDDYAAEDDIVRLRFRFASDGGWSDED